MTVLQSVRQESSPRVQPVFPDPPLPSRRMSPEPLARFSVAADFVAYDRQGVERFFEDAFAERRRLLQEIAQAMARIAAAEAALADADSDECYSVESVLQGQRLLRAEARANERAIEALAAQAEASAARILAAVRTDGATGRSKRTMGPAPSAPTNVPAASDMNPLDGGPGRSMFAASIADRLR